MKTLTIGLNRRSSLSKPSPELVKLVASGLIELLGVAAITWGAALVFPALGFIVGGVGALWIARAIDPPQKPLIMFKRRGE